MGSQKSSIELFLCPAGERRQSLERGLTADALAEAGDGGADAGSARPHEFLDPGGDPNSLRDQGWGVIAPRGDDGDRLLALVRPLLAKRAADQDGEVPVYRVPPGLTAAQSATWIDRILVGNELHEDVPGYLLILGAPDQVSFELQQVVTGGFRVGRLGFGDDAGYESYVDKLLRHEAAPAAPARAVYFTARDGTPATDLGHRMLIQPCVADAEQQRDAGRFAAGEIAVVEGAGDPARAAGDLLAAVRERAVLLSCSHGAGPPRGGWDSAERRRAVQGALCLGGGRQLEAADLARVPFLPGGVWMMFACFGAGTPAHSAYYHWLSRLSRHGAHEGDLSALLDALPRDGEPPFLAALPQAALANPDGPLAIIGHLDLAWSYGFHDLDKMSRGERHRRFHEIVAQLAKGSRVGLALGGSLMRTRSQIETELAIAADDDARAAESGDPAGDDLDRQIRLGHRCMLLQDLRGYIALGDPAARMAVTRPARKAAARAVYTDAGRRTASALATAAREPDDAT